MKEDFTLPVDGLVERQRGRWTSSPAENFRGRWHLQPQPQRQPAHKIVFWGGTVAMAVKSPPGWLDWRRKVWHRNSTAFWRWGLGVSYLFSLDHSFFSSSDTFESPRKMRCFDGATRGLPRRHVSSELSAEYSPRVCGSSLLDCSLHCHPLRGILLRPLGREI